MRNQRRHENYLSTISQIAQPHYQRYLKGLDKPQLGIVNGVTQDGRKMVIAEPGTGKTHLAFVIILKLLAVYKVDPDTIEVVSFSKKAKKMLQTRLDSVFRGTFIKIKVRTFHSFAKYYVRKSRGDLAILNEKQMKAILGKIMVDDHKMLIDDKDLLPRLATMRGSKYLWDNTELSSLDARILDEYEKKLSSEKKTDYTQILIDFICLITDPQTNGEKIIVNDIKKNLKYLICDEFQDCSKLMTKIIAELDRLTLGNGWLKELSFLLVGDPHQSIYEFDVLYCQGHWSIFSAMDRYYKNNEPFNQRKVLIARLKKSRRSHPSIQCVYRSIMGYADDYPKNAEKRVFFIKYDTYKPMVVGMVELIVFLLSTSETSTILILYRTKSGYWQGEKNGLVTYMKEQLRASGIKYHAVPKKSKKIPKPTKVPVPEGVRVIFNSIHGEKGGEGTYVFIPHFSEGYLPRRDSKVLNLSNLNAKKANFVKQLEKRLTFVGISRGEFAVFLFHATWVHDANFCFRNLPTSRAKKVFPSTHLKYFRNRCEIVDGSRALEVIKSRNLQGNKLILTPNK